MSERSEVPKALDTNTLRGEYYAGFGYAMRWDLYLHTEDGRKLHEDIPDVLGLEGTESVLDMGCGQGEFLSSLQESGHEGLLVGIDINGALGSAISQNVQLLIADASLDQGGVEHVPHALPFKNNSFDVIFALFMLYHVHNPEVTLRDAIRVLSPGGRLVVATSATDNKPQHRRYEAIIASALGVNKPPIYASHFNADAADELLSRMFCSVQEEEQVTSVVIGEADFANGLFSEKIKAYINSLKSMADHYDPKVFTSEMNVPIKQLVLPDIRRQIDAYGNFVEPIHRKLYVCSSPRGQ